MHTHKKYHTEIRNLFHCYFDFISIYNHFLPFYLSRNGIQNQELASRVVACVVSGSSIKSECSDESLDRDVAV